MDMKGWTTKGQKGRGWTMGISHLGTKKTQGQEDYEDGIGQVEEYDEIVVLGGGQTHVYIRNDEDGVCQAKKKIQKHQTLVNYAWTVW